MRYRTQKKVNYEVQPISDQESAKMHYGGTKRVEGSRICDITREVLSNGMLPCQRDALEHSVMAPLSPATVCVAGGHLPS